MQIYAYLELLIFLLEVFVITKVINIQYLVNKKFDIFLNIDIGHLCNIA